MNSPNTTPDTDKPDNLEAVMRRVRKLLAIAEDGRGDVNEAAAAARMAESIMRKYQIAHADVIAVELQSSDAFDSADVSSVLDPNAEGTKQSAAWSGILAVPIAKLNDCQARYAKNPTRGKVIRFSGFAADVQVCRFTYEYIVNAMVLASRNFLKATRCSRAEAESFRRGFVSEVCSMLRQAKAEKDAQMQEASASRSLVIVKGDAVAKHFGETRYRKANLGSQGAAFAYGRAEASKLDVNRRGVGHTGSNTPRLG
jgi:hypothetical protein